MKFFLIISYIPSSNFKGRMSRISKKVQHQRDVKDIPLHLQVYHTYSLKNIVSGSTYCAVDTCMYNLSIFDAGRLEITARKKSGSISLCISLHDCRKVVLCWEGLYSSVAEMWKSFQYSSILNNLLPIRKSNKVPCGYSKIESTLIPMSLTLTRGLIHYKDKEGEGILDCWHPVLPVVFAKQEVEIPKARLKMLFEPTPHSQLAESKLPMLTTIAKFFYHYFDHLRIFVETYQCIRKYFKDIAPADFFSTQYIEAFNKELVFMHENIVDVLLRHNPQCVKVDKLCPNKPAFDAIISAVRKCIADKCDADGFYRALVNHISFDQIRRAANHISGFKELNTQGYQTVRSNSNSYHKKKMRGQERNQIITFAQMGKRTNSSWVLFACIKPAVLYAIETAWQTNVSQFSAEGSVVVNSTAQESAAAHPGLAICYKERGQAVSLRSFKEGEYMACVAGFQDLHQIRRTGDTFTCTSDRLSNPQFPDHPFKVTIVSIRDKLADGSHLAISMHCKHKQAKACGAIASNRLWSLSLDRKLLVAAVCEKDAQRLADVTVQTEYDMQAVVFSKTRGVLGSHSSLELYCTDQHLLFAVVFTNREGKNRLAHIAVDIDDPLKCVASMTIKKSWTVGSCFYMRSASNHAMHVAVSKAHNSFQVVAWSRSKFLMIIDLHHSRGMIRELQGNEIGRPAVGYDCSEKCLAVSFFPKRGYPICHLYPLKM